MPDQNSRTSNPAKLTSQEMLDFYRSMHAQEILRDKNDELAPVISGGVIPAVNRFVDFAHRRGMRHAFEYLTKANVRWAGAEVLDLGCGRGRWVREYADRGAHVTGVDISDQAIEILREVFSDHRFIAGDVAALDFAPNSFDIVNSVTVVQHLPEERQRLVFQHSSQWIKPGGWLVMLENTAHFASNHVFAHSRDVWVSLAEAEGFRLYATWPSNFEAGLQAFNIFRRRTSTVEASSGQSSTTAAAPKWKPLLRKAVLSSAAYVSYPLEPICARLPLIAPTHHLMIFRK